MRNKVAAYAGFAVDVFCNTLDEITNVFQKNVRYCSLRGIRGILFSFIVKLEASEYFV